MRHCGCVSEVRVNADFGTKLIFRLVQEYGAYFLTKVEIVDLELFGS